MAVPNVNPAGLNDPAAQPGGFFGGYIDPKLQGLNIQQVMQLYGISGAPPANNALTGQGAQQPLGGGGVYAGGSQWFDESTGRYLTTDGQPPNATNTRGDPSYSATPLVGPAGTNNGPAPTTPGGTSQTTPGFQGFPNFQVPFPYLNLPAQLQASMQTPRNQTYGRFGQAPNTGMPAPNSGMPQLPPQPPQQNGSGFLPVQPPSPSGLPQLPGTVSAGNLPPGPGGGMPGFAPNQGSSYAQMKADTLNQLTAGQRQRAQAYANSGPSLAQFQQTFQSLPTDAAKFQYWNSLPNNGAGAIDQYLSTVPGFRSWVNEMFNNYNGGSLAGLR